jgi:hypothetical protein
MEGLRGNGPLVSVRLTVVGDEGEPPAQGTSIWRSVNGDVGVASAHKRLVVGSF